MRMPLKISFALILFISGGISNPVSGASWNKESALTYTQVCSLAVEAMVSWIKCGTNPSELYWFVARDGNDAQVAATGLSRDTLVGRASGYLVNILNSRGPTKAKWDSSVAVIKAMYAGGNFPTVLEYSYTNSPNRPASLSFDDRMDYGNSGNYITWACVPQDFADPRLIAGRPIKEWVANYTRGLQPDRAAIAEASYAPDFSNFHHYVTVNGYSLSNYGHTNVIYNLYYNKLLRFQLPDVALVSPNTHFKDLSRWFNISTNGNGYFCDPQGSHYPPLISPREPVIPACLYNGDKSPTALALAARTFEAKRIYFEQMRKAYEKSGVYPSGWFENDVSQNSFLQGYMLLKLLGATDSPITYDSARKSLDGTYWYRNLRYAVHRTPDKIVTVGWNCIANASGTMYAVPFDSLSRAERLKRTAVSVTNWAVTQVVPDNELLRPDSEVLLIRGDGSMLGDLATYANSETMCRVDRSDAMLSTAGCANRTVSAYDTTSRARQYQSFTSFYDKTCISLVKIVEGAGGRGSNTEWKNAFAASFLADASAPYARRMTYFEGDSMDINSLATLSNVAGPETPLGNHSTWWCMGGRLGIATLGGAGYFSASHFIGGTENISWDKVPRGVNVRRFEPLSAGSVMVNMAAAYFTDTPPLKVKELQSKLMSLDAQLPDGWKGLCSETPEGQRVMALAHFYDAATDTANIRLAFAEGAPVLETETHFSGDTAIGRFVFTALQSLGQTLAFYMVGAGNDVVARQIGDLQVELAGNGNVTLKYLSRAESNTLFVNGVSLSKTKSELATGVQITLAAGSTTVVRVENSVDNDHIGPAVQMVYPQYQSDVNCMFQGPYNPNGGTVYTNQPDTISVNDEGLLVQVDLKDRSGVAWADVYLDWKLVGRITGSPYEYRIPHDAFIPDTTSANLVDKTIHSIHMVACDALGNKTEGTPTPFRVKLSSGTAIERVMLTHGAYVERKVSTSSVFKANQRLALHSESTSKTTLIINPSVVEKRIKVSGQSLVDGVRFVLDGANESYWFCLDAKGGKARLIRGDGKKQTLVAETIHPSLLNHWYEMRLTIEQGVVSGFVNGVKLVSANKD